MFIYKYKNKRKMKKENESTLLVTLQIILDERIEIESNHK